MPLGRFLFYYFGYGYSCNHVTFCWYVTTKIVYKIRLCPKDAEFAVM